MLKKLLAVVFGAFFAFSAHAAQIANVEYIHNLIANRIGIELPYNPKLHSVKQVANMEYLLTAVDVVNEMLNGEVTTTLGTGEYATKQVADVDISAHAVNELVQEEWPFAITTTENASSFGFILGAEGTFMVDWGDGTIETIERTDSKFMLYNHSYATPGAYTVRFGGKATGYAYLDVDPIVNALQRFVVDGDETALQTLEIPSEGITISFLTDSDRIAHIEGSLGSVFPTLENGDNPQFVLTFAGAMNWDGIIPERLFSRIYGQPAPLMFTGTFALSNLKAVPEKLFVGLYGNPSYAMNAGTFLLTPMVEGEIPSNLYSNLKGAPDRGAFLGTFALSGFKGEIPSGLFAGLKGQAKEAAFALTFAGMPYIEGRIPAKLFAGISGRPMAAQYLGTFAGSGIDLIALMNGGDIEVLTGAGFTGAIPEGLFAKLNGAPGELAFAGTFGANFGLKGSIPEDLFKGVKGAPAPGMFLGTFAGCIGLSGEIPGGLFRNVVGKPALGMFGFTFIEDDRLSGIGDGLFAGISGAAELGMFFYTFFSISDLEGPSAKGKDGKYLYEIWPEEFTGAYAYSNKLEDYAVIPQNWGGLGEVGVGEPHFVLTTTPGTTSFDFDINAAGTFAVDWGDGEVESVMHIDTSNITFAHTYEKPGEYTIKVSGKALAYYNGNGIATVSFENNQNLAKFDGSFREMFPVLPLVVGKLLDAPNFYRTFADCKNLKGEIPEDLFPEGIFTASLTTGINPVFFQTFSGCSGLTGSIPAKLFAGVSGMPVDYMFKETFAGCTGLTGSIPADLFATIKGQPAYAMFHGTFDGCTGLTGSIPAGLFSGIVGAPAPDMFVRTFANCTGLTGTIPGGLFGGINGYPASYMFDQTFAGCTGLTGSIPADLFIGITAGSNATDMFYGTFSGCTGLTGVSAQNNGQYLYNIWDPSYMNTMYCGVDKLTDVETMPDAVKECGESSFVDWSDWKFEFITQNSSSVGFTLAAAGTFYVDWGDGNVQKVERTSATAASVTHTYRRSGNYTIKLGGTATAYSATDTQPVIKFDNYVVYSISGSLGKIFPTLADGTQPSFYQTFSGNTSLRGRIPDDLFDGIVGAPRAYMFYRTFYNCYNLTGAIPEGLFAGVKGAPAPYMFCGTFDLCSGLGGAIPAGLFAGIKGAPAAGMFSGTFSNCSALSGSVPAGLFAGVSGEAATEMFFQTFNGCTGLTGTGVDLIGALSGTAKGNMFGYMFRGCRNLTGNTVKAGGKYLYQIWPDATFAQIGGIYEGAVGLAGMACESEDQVPLSWGGPVCLDEWPVEITTTSLSSFSFYIAAKGTFYVDWGDGATQVIEKTDTSRVYYSHSYSKYATYKVKLAGVATAYNTSYSTPTISFGSTSSVAGISGSLGKMFPTLADGSQPSFYQTFYNMSNLTGQLPENLFEGIEGTPRTYMFYQTFYGCKGLTGSIPAGLFAGLDGAPASYMFYQTFYGCSGLTGSIPAGLFAGIKGAPASYMFSQTFYGCSGLTGIGGALFAGITGAPASYMFNQTFFGCTGLTGQLPANMFGNISGTAASNMFTQTFQGCAGLTGPSAKIGDSYLYEIWPTATAAQVGDMYTGCNGLSDNSCETGVTIPAVWGAQACVDDWAFEYQTTNTSDTTVSLSAKGTFYVDWGDGSSSVIERTDTSLKSYKHVYATSAVRTVKVAGLATAYSTNDKTATVKFTKVASVTGNFGALFPTLTDGSQPSFYQTFSGNSSLKAVPADLFAGIKGAPRNYMFYETFSGCSSLKEIPADLFAEISGSPVDYLFYGTFNGCSSLKEIPADLFAGIKGAPAPYMFYATFSGCYGLTALPESLFAGLDGAPAANMFKQTFANCYGLTAVPENLFAGIKGAPAGNMFEATFSGCSQLTAIPSGLFAGIKGAPASNMFKQTFQDCSNLTEVPSGLFAGLDGAPATYMFQYAFSGCTKLTTVPADLFAGIKGAPANYMFQYVFNGCNKLAAIPSGLFAGISGKPASGMFGYAFASTAIKSIPADLFAGIKGAPAANMFQQTFYNCDGLTTIPAGLFSGIVGAPAKYMFSETFRDCDSLTTIPAGLFAGISGKPATYMFYYTFYDCGRLTAIPENLFGSISGSAVSNMFYYTWGYCSSLKGPSAKIDGKYLYEIWPSSSQYAYRNSTGLTDYSSIPSYWK